MLPNDDPRTELDKGEVIEVIEDDGFRPPESPVIPIADGDGISGSSSIRRVLDVATDRMGREIHWLPIAFGTDAHHQYGTAIPQASIDALCRFRLGVLGPITGSDTDRRVIATTLQEELGLSTAVSRITELDRPPSSIDDRFATDVTTFRTVTVGGRLLLDRPIDDTAQFCDHRYRPSNGTIDDVVDSGLEGSERTRTAALETLVDQAMTYALDRDRRQLTIAHRSGGSFLSRAREYLVAEYGDVILVDPAFQATVDAAYPDEEIIITERQLPEIRQGLAADPSQFDVIIAPAQAGSAITRTAADVAGSAGIVPEVLLGDDRVIAAPQLLREAPHYGPIPTPTSLLLAGCTLFEYIGWMDAASSIRQALAVTLGDGIVPPDLIARTGPTPATDTETFADAITDRFDRLSQTPGMGGVQTTASERSRIKRVIAGLYRIVFDDRIAVTDIELNQLLDEDEEADIYLPEVGINLYYWRRWPAERRLEVLLHEFAHVKEGPDERDHGVEFYERFVDLVATIATNHDAIEALFGNPIDIGRLHRFIVESVHEETIEPDLESVGARKRWLRDRFGLDASTHY
ncbi:MAG: isocitrate/isopropylmalate family dehydrogenase [Halobacteriales archaeon]